MNKLKQLLKKLVRLSGKTLVPINTYQESLELVKYNWLKNKNIKTIIDVGANDGGFIRRFRSVFPEAMIYAYEAMPDPYKRLNIKLQADKRLKTYNVALSNYKGEVDFYVSSNEGSSSLLQMEEIHKINFPGSAKNTQIKVKCDLLDNFLTEINFESNVLMKLDVQGAERLVLEGATKTIELIDVIYCEVNFQELYKDAVLITDLILLLKKYNFNLAGIENIYQSVIDGSFTHGDAIFIKEKK
ncbi:MAG: FkbM family methyltransferase [Bacteroidota bacterium]